MKKRFESLNSVKFAPLNRKSLSQITGGRDTEGSSKVVQQQSNNVYYPAEATYRWTNQNLVRSWTSDAIGEDGTVCYWGESFTWVNA
jgi:hypothetical protein